MDVRRFQVREEDFDPEGRTLGVEGELDLAVADRLQEAIDKAAADGRANLLVDLSRCSFIDSTGIAVIMRAQAERRLIVFGATSGVKRVFAVTGLDDDDR